MARRSASTRRLVLFLKFSLALAILVREPRDVLAMVGALSSLENNNQSTQFSHAHSKDMTHI